MSNHYNPNDVKKALERDFITPLKDGYIPTYQDRISMPTRKVSPTTAQKWSEELQAAFESVNYNLYDFLKSEQYERITSPLMRFDVMSYFLEWSPLKQILTSNDPNETDYFRNGKRLAEQDFLIKENKEDSWSPQPGHIYYLKDYVLAELFHIETESDFWDWIAKGNGNFKELSAFYKDYYSEDKQFEFLTYLIKKDTDERDLFVEELKENCLYINNWDFFAASNIDYAKKAWETGILEIRQEFVRDGEAINMLKIILSQS